MTEEQVFAGLQAEVVRSKPPGLHRHQLAGHLNLALGGLGVNLRPVFHNASGIPVQCQPREVRAKPGPCICFLFVSVLPRPISVGRGATKAAARDDAMAEFLLAGAWASFAPPPPHTPPYRPHPLPPPPAATLHIPHPLPPPRPLPPPPTLQPPGRAYRPRPQGEGKWTLHFGPPVTARELGGTFLLATGGALPAITQLKDSAEQSGFAVDILVEEMAGGGGRCAVFVEGRAVAAVTSEGGGAREQLQGLMGAAAEAAVRHLSARLPVLSFWSRTVDPTRPALTRDACCRLKGELEEARHGKQVASLFH